MLDAPCVWCAYDGVGYWQEGTHAESCPWHNVGGLAERLALVADAVAARLKTLAREREERELEAQQFRKAVDVAGALFQPGGKYHDRSLPLLWGRSTVIDGMKWLDKQLTATESALATALRERDEANTLLDEWLEAQFYGASSDTLRRRTQAFRRSHEKPMPAALRPSQEPPK